MPLYTIITKEGPLEQTFQTIEEASAYMSENKIAGARLDMVPPKFEDAYAALCARVERASSQRVPGWVDKISIKTTEVWLQDHWGGKRVLRFPTAIYSPARYGYIGYTADLRGLMEGRQKSVPFSRFLAEFTDLSSSEISRLNGRYASARNMTMKISFSMDDFVEAYLTEEMSFNGSTSCMSSSGASFGLSDDDHPASAYAGEETSHPDPLDDKAVAEANYTDRLAIAIGRNDAGLIVARSVVWPTKKTYVRSYGLTSHAAEGLAALLAEAGYQRASNLEGARVFLRDHPTGGFIMPYIDGNVQTITQDGIIDRHGCSAAANTSGRIYMDPPVCCDRCDEETDPDDLRSVIVDMRGSAAQTERWCNVCREESAFYCELSCEYYSSDEFTQVSVAVRRPGGYNTTSYGCEEYLERTTQAFFCDRDDTWVYSRAGWLLREVVVDSAGGVQMWSFPNGGSVEGRTDAVMINDTIYAVRSERYPDGVNISEGATAGSEEVR